MAKLRGKNLAVGHWSNPHKRAILDQTAFKVRALLEDKLITLGRVVELWQPVTQLTPGAVLCSCVKNTSDAADRGCFTCFGTKFAPAYLKFGHVTSYFCSSDLTGLTLNNVVPVRVLKANTLALAANQLTGTIISTAQSYTNSQLVDWTVHISAFKRAPGQTITLEYSIDSQMSWSMVTLSETILGRGYEGTLSGTTLGLSGAISFRITLLRAAVGDLSPNFEILRLRRVKAETTTERLIYRRPDWSPGKIIINRPWTAETQTLEPGRGSLYDHKDNPWTAPLDLFDTSITRDTPPCRIADNAVGSHPFFQYSSGVQAGTRYAILEVSFSEQFGTFTHQRWADRRVQDGESYQLVW